MKMLKKRLREKKEVWVEKLLTILWACRPTAKTPTGETPFTLSYRSEAVIRVEVGIQSHRTLNFKAV